MTDTTFSRQVQRWYDENARDLPWRTPEVGGWGVLVSEVMLQQTPVARVVPAWESWMTRWPTPAALAAVAPGEAVREWGRLGYPRRALRLHEAATEIVARHGGVVPSAYDDLLALPGVGGYTAAAVAVFGYGGRHAVLDTNVRRVYARVFAGAQDAATSSPTRSEQETALALVPTDEPAHYSVAVMELGALVCTARDPRCGGCPVSGECTWLIAGRPEGLVVHKTQTYAGTDRQVRGRLLAVLRDAPDLVAKPELDVVWDDEVQRERSLSGLIEDGLVEPVGDDHFRLPT
ncbi:MAG TPA: A/G-specific adenine glycosylase [Mycobacteriales bacterium]|jgi:A/G-specific adenine glycosylase|nr:A/G-specific adenine glycosylase [Mycobacteriales bacterium]